MLKITIPKPCHEDWEAMTPNQQGRHCTACAKTVVDFSLMADEEVKYFLLQQQEKTLCGRFKNDQLQRVKISLPANILQIYLPLWKQFLTACLLAFSSMLFSCNTVIERNKIENLQTIGEPIAPVFKQGINAEKVIVGDFNYTADSMLPPVVTLPVCTSTMGVAIVYDSAVQSEAGIQLKELNEQIIEDTACTIPDTFTNSSTKIIEPAIDSAKTKNPQKADSTDCSNMKYY